MGDGGGLPEAWLRVWDCGAEKSALGGALQVARWSRSPRTDADGQCEFRYQPDQPDGWGKAYRFVALRYLNQPKPQKRKEAEQYQLFDAPKYHYRVFVTDLDAPSTRWWGLTANGREGEPDQGSQ